MPKEKTTVSFSFILMYCYLQYMLKVLFYIRYRGQLRRTRPELVASLENAVAEAASAAGGSTAAGRRVLSASFDEDRIGFWLDMLIFLERVCKALERASGELYGHVVALGRDIPELCVEKLCRSLAGKGNGTGIWCSEEVRRALELYMDFGSARGNANGSRRGLLARSSEESDVGFNCDEYSELREFRSFEREGGYPYREKIERVLALGTDKNTVLFGPEFIGKKDGVHHFCKGLLGDIPPLVVRFGSGGRELVCFADAFTPQMSSFIAGSAEAGVMQELDTIHDLLFRERLREEWSPYMMDRGRCFIRSLIIVPYLFAYGIMAVYALSGFKILQRALRRLRFLPILFCFK